MELKNRLLIIDGKDKTGSVSSINFSGGKWEVVFRNSPKVYRYNDSNVHILKPQRRIDPTSVVAVVRGTPCSGVSEIVDFGEFYQFTFENGRRCAYPRSVVALEENCIACGENKTLFEYFKETASAISLVTAEGRNILELQYNRVGAVSGATVLACYFNQENQPQTRVPPQELIYPFGLNQSQKKAVENAFSSQVSIIQGPPGTGKTQTILNIIANAVRAGKIVAVVSNNNAATMNVKEKLEKKELGFLTAFLGSRDNKVEFLAGQTGRYPDMRTWEIEKSQRLQMKAEVNKRANELNEMLNTQNRIAEIEREVSALKAEQHYFEGYCSQYGNSTHSLPALTGYSGKKLLALWVEYEQTIESGTKLSWWKGVLKYILRLFRFSLSAAAMFRASPEEVLPHLQRQYYVTRLSELQQEKKNLERRLDEYHFERKMNELSEMSMQLFRAELAQRYQYKKSRSVFEMSDFRRNSLEFNREYPVILSTTYSIKGTLSLDYTYDYLIVDEASQVDLATGVLALSCAKNVIIVGDEKQLPNVLTEDDIRIADEVARHYPVKEPYRFSRHSLLSSANIVWESAPKVMLKEHYRCHPKIAEFFNQKFYHGNLIVMTKDQGEKDVLRLYKTAAGNHARGHLNQRQIDVIREEVLPCLAAEGYEDIGIITPYRDQVRAIGQQLGSRYDVATVHKFQGREKDAIVLTTVDNVIGEFVDDPHLLNVAVSRAVRSLSVVISQDEANRKTNFGDLVKYIEYNNFEVIVSSVYSVFDLLYKGYAEQRRIYLQKHKRVSEYDSENLMYAEIENIMKEREFSGIDCAVHVSLNSVIKDFSLLSAQECQFARNPLTHVDFLLFSKMDKAPLLAIEVDGTSYHAQGSRQAERDAMKNSIFSKIGVPILRLRTDGSNERQKVEEVLRRIL